MDVHQKEKVIHINLKPDATYHALDVERGDAGRLISASDEFANTLSSILSNCRV